MRNNNIQGNNNNNNCDMKLETPESGPAWERSA